MECAAIAEICLELKKPLIAIKGVTDIVDPEILVDNNQVENSANSAQQFLINLFHTCNNMADVTKLAVEFVLNKRLTDL